MDFFRSSVENIVGDFRGLAYRRLRRGGLGLCAEVGRNFRRQSVHFAAAVFLALSPLFGDGTDHSPYVLHHLVDPGLEFRGSVDDVLGANGCQVNQILRINLRCPLFFAEELAGSGTRAGIFIP